jgi:hypothetical protein
MEDDGGKNVLAQEEWSSRALAGFFLPLLFHPSPQPVGQCHLLSGEVFLPHANHLLSYLPIVLETS